MDERMASAIASDVENWFRHNKRDLPWREKYEPYHVWISEFMAQQTRMEVVLGYFPRFIEKFPSIAALAQADEEDVVAAWSGLGYYRRARMLHRSAREIVERFDGRLPRDVTTLQTLYGFGPYTAGAVSSIAFEVRTPLVDGNVTRIVARLETIESPWRSRELEKQAWSVAGLLVDACHSPRDLNQGLMELGASICRPKNPDCEACPLTGNCEARAKRMTEAYPRPAPKARTIALEIPVYIFEDARGRVLFRRADGSLMNGMYQLPQGNEMLFGNALEVANPGESLGSFTHTITNRRIRFTLYCPQLPERVADSGGEWTWIDPGALAEHPHPSWVRKAIERWKSRAE